MQNIITITHTHTHTKKTNKQTNNKEWGGVTVCNKVKYQGVITSPQIFCRLVGLYSRSEYLFTLHQCAVEKPIRYIKRSNLEIDAAGNFAPLQKSY